MSCRTLRCATNLCPAGHCAVPLSYVLQDIALCHYPMSCRTLRCATIPCPSTQQPLKLRPGYVEHPDTRHQFLKEKSPQHQMSEITAGSGWQHCFAFCSSDTWYRKFYSQDSCHKVSTDCIPPYGLLNAGHTFGHDTESQSTTQPHPLYALSRTPLTSDVRTRCASGSGRVHLIFCIDLLSVNSRTCGPPLDAV